jgi:hypothetical protein
MLYTEIIAVCSKTHTKHINTLCGQNAIASSLNLYAKTDNIRIYRVKIKIEKSVTYAQPTYA